MFGETSKWSALRSERRINIASISAFFAMKAAVAWLLSLGLRIIVQAPSGRFDDRTLCSIGSDDPLDKQQ